MKTKNDATKRKQQSRMNGRRATRGPDFALTAYVAINAIAIIGTNTAAPSNAAMPNRACIPPFRMAATLELISGAPLPNAIKVTPEILCDTPKVLDRGNWRGNEYDQWIS